MVLGARPRRVLHLPLGALLTWCTVRGTDYRRGSKTTRLGAHLQTSASGNGHVELLTSAGNRVRVAPAPPADA